MQWTSDLAKPAFIIQSVGLREGNILRADGDESIEMESCMIVAGDSGEERVDKGVTGELAGIEEGLVLVGWELEGWGG